MRFCFILVVPLLFFACNQPKHAKIEGFWEDFQKSIATNNKTAVADMTVFPLKGTEFVGAEFNESGLNREQFLKEYEQLFDEKVKQAIAGTSVDKLIKFVSQKAEALQKLGVPPNSEIYSMTVTYVSEEGQETQTESTVAFYFLKKEGVFKLAFLLIAG